MKTLKGLSHCFLQLVLFSYLVSCGKPGKIGLHSSEDVFVITTTDSVSNDDISAEATTTIPDSSENNDVKVNNPISNNAPDLITQVDELRFERRRSNVAAKGTMKPEIYSFRIRSDIRYRYSRTHVTSRVANRNKDESQEVTFRVVLPETAFISKFAMEIDEKVYEAYVKEKEEAKKDYTQAQSQGHSAGLVEVNSRHSNVFNVNVNIRAESKVTFNLTYEELLSRRLGRYEQTINISPEQVTNVKDFQIAVNIEESQNITFLRVPNIRNDIEAQEDSEGNNKDAVILRPAGNRANITWSPSEKDQAALSKQGLTGKFVIQYDINRDTNAGEVLVMEGYFVHFFAPTNLQPLRKHVVFILDVSGSMWGRKMEQLKESQKKILEDLSPDDFFNIITFSSDVFLWSPDDEVPKDPNSSYWVSPSHAETTPKPADAEDLKRQPFAASKTNIEKAKKFIDSLVASGGTNIHDAITKALTLIESIKNARDGKVPTTTISTTTEAETLPTAIPLEDNTAVFSDDATTTVLPENVETSTSNSNSTAISSKKTVLPKYVESLIIFLTDGEPTVGISNPTQIQTLIHTANRNISVPIFSLAFGEGADFQFVRKLSLQNHGFARKIYEASDAALQLKGFYNEIASPLLSNVTFNYTSPEYNITDVTLTKFPTIFGGTEVAVAGKLTPVGYEDEVSATEAVIDQMAVETVENGTAPTVKRRELSISDKYYFDVTVVGSGREGAIDFSNPEIFTESIPWGETPLRPYPPRPTPPPSQEDQFLERLWAYLTIQQLIERDLAEIIEDNTIEEDDAIIRPVSSTVKPDSTENTTDTKTSTKIKETPKQQALRLALKYSFVTSLTSLVVVKPNSSDVANADSVDAKPLYADSLSVATVTANRIGSGNHHFAALPLSLSQNNFHQPVFALPIVPHKIAIGGFAGATIAPHHSFGVSAGPPSSFGSPHIPYYPTSQLSSNDEDISEQLSTTATPILYQTSSAPAPLTLQNIQWFQVENPKLTINSTEYIIQQNSENVSSTAGNTCTVKSIIGQCRHLKDCVRSDFITDVNLFKDTYFCPIKSLSGNDAFVGTCCTD